MCYKAAMANRKKQKDGGLSPAAERLLATAEQLYALEGFDAVSMRQVAKASGQKNTSALAYHFGTQEGLIEAILDYRMMPINARRQLLLDEVLRKGQEAEPWVLVEVLVRPLSEALKKGPESSYDVSLLNQLYNRDHSLKVLQNNPKRVEAIETTLSYLSATLSHLPIPQLTQRLSLMGRQISHAIQDWAFHLRTGTPGYSESNIEWLALNLIDYVVGGLLAPVSGKGTFQIDV